MKGSNMEDIKELVKNHLEQLEQWVDVFFYHGDKPSSTEDNLDMKYYGYSKDLNRDTLLHVMSLMTEKYKGVISDENWEKLNENIRHKLHHTFELHEYDLVGGIKSIDIDLYTISREDYDKFHNLNKEFVELE